MTQSHSAPASAGSEHRVKPTVLALHVASAASWGRPWRRRALSLPAPQALTFQGIRLPLQPLRSWLHLLSNAGMLGVRPPAVSIQRQPDDDEDVPARIEDLAFELSTEMILDFTQFARQSRLDAAAEQIAAGPPVEASGDADMPAPASRAGIDEWHALDMTDSVTSDSVDQDLLATGLHMAPPSAEAATAAQEQIAALATTHEQPVPVDTLNAKLALHAAEPEVAAKPEVDSEQLSESQHEEASDTPKSAAPAIAVSDVRLARRPAVRLQPAVEQELAAQIADVPEAAEASMAVVETAAETAVEQILPEITAVPDTAAVDVHETTVVPVSGTEVTVEQPHPETVEVAQHPTAKDLATVMPWEPLEPVPLRDMISVDTVSDPVQQAASANEFAFEPMIAGLEDALAALTAASAVHDEAPAAPVLHASTAVPLTAKTLQLDDSIPEAALQGIFIQKETEMTEMRDESIEVDAQNTAPISSVELQEVAATLSAPQLEADPDDVLSDVQSTLNSLAGMAQGLTQQKQAAGRLQEELEEWNAQLQERERLASDKEERLQQLESHLKEAKTNLDRMAAENNRLLAERSEALKELAQTVDLRDKTTVKRAEAIQLEQQRIDEQLASLRNRASELDDRESALKRKSEELGVRLKQLQSAKDKFSAIVKSFNETVQFNSTLSAISKTVNE